MSSRLVASDGGFGLIEVMVSMVLLTALALTTFALIDQSTANSAQGRSRSVAANLVHADLNRLRQMQFDTASQTNFEQVTSTQGIDGVTYTIDSRAAWTTDTGTAVSCTSPSGAAAAYLRISSTVTWPAMGKAKPATAESILVPRAKEINRTAGSLMVQVHDSHGSPVSDVAVVAGQHTLTTGAAGCVFFPQINAGQVPITFTKSNYVDIHNASPGTDIASVVNGQTTSESVSFDRPVTFNPVTFYSETGNAPKWTSGSITSTAGTTVYGAAATQRAFATDPFYPVSSGFLLYAGSCAGNNPATYMTNPQVLSLASLAPAPGSPVTNAVAYMRPVTLAVTGATSGNPLKYFIKPFVSSAYPQMTSCGEPLLNKSFPVNADSSGKANLTVDLPYGIYSICVENTETPRTGSTNKYKAKLYTDPISPSAYNTAPLNAYSNMPTVATTTLNSTAPKADGVVSGSPFTAALPLVAATTDKCT